jgi:type IX secretion system PorP/SprF family membrane protein
MKQILKINLALLLLTGGTALGQQLPFYSQYMYNPFLYNPGFTGLDENTKAFLVHRNQWKDMPGSPTTNVLSVDGNFPDNDKIGLGFFVYQDVTDIIERMGLGASYSYRIDINADHKIHAGVNFGVVDQNIDFSRAVIKDKNDPFLFNDRRRKVGVDANLGLAYLWKDLRVGVSVPQLIGQEIKYISSGSNAFYQLRRHLVGSANYSFFISESNLIKCIPGFLVRYSAGAPLQYDVYANLDWKDFIRGGFTYRSNYAVGAHVGVKINKSISAGYYYDYIIGKIGSYSGGGHEIMLGYTFGAKRSAPKEDSYEKKQADAMVDSMLMILKNNDDQQKREIEKLNDEIKQLKEKSDAGGGSGGGSGGSGSVEDTTGTMRKAMSGDFKDDGGRDMTPGFYVVVGAFKSKENASQEYERFLKKGYQGTQFMFNPKRGLYYVYILKTPNKSAATSELAEIQAEAKGSWVYELQ